MDLLLDSHVALWWATAPGTLRTEASAAVAAPTNEVFVSAASAWELAIKVRSGRLSVDVDALFRDLVDHGTRLLGIGVDDAVRAGGLDWSHRDPFDRMLVAQAQRLSLTLLTRDAAILVYDGASSLAA